MTKSLQAFIKISSVLTGYSELQLGAADVAVTYQSLLESLLQANIYERLMSQAEALPDDDYDAEREVVALLIDPVLGPVLRNIILVWYTGTWNTLPDDWRQTFGMSALDRTHVVSSSAYKGGLQWLASGGHASGANHQGFGAWSFEPREARL
ncbi:hypothetical protein G6L28_17090 [Agrobacterium larrymoorei]|uniref:hypothetical protein n=1 Tax=Agrobacterium larrymoorei TaxID=160699 RepID=UPI001572F5BE|nr:hypothetical protein [Agrobacterium larrymoorei]NTJ44313.1 hypothetical protein [Agrobacterium larrymoorei]